MNFSETLTFFREAIPDLATRVECPHGCGFVNPFSGVYEKDCRSILNRVVHLNDFHLWTREEIASWLELTAAELGLNLELSLPQHQQEKQ